LRLDRKSTIEELQDKLHFVPWFDLHLGGWRNVFFLIQCDNDAKALTELDETKGNSAETFSYQLKDAPVLPLCGSMAESFWKDAKCDCPKELLMQLRKELAN